MWDPHNRDVYISAVTNKNAPNATVLAALTLLYACSTVGLAREWDMVLTLIPENGHSVLDLLDSPSIDFGTSIVVKQLAVDMGLVIADALLVSLTALPSRSYMLISCRYGGATGSGGAPFASSCRR